MSSLNKKLIFFVSFLSTTSISYASGLFSADFFCTIAQQTNGKCPELPTDEQSLINVLSNLLFTEFKTVYDSLPTCAADEKLENNVCVKTITPPPNGGTTTPTNGGTTTPTNGGTTTPPNGGTTTPPNGGTTTPTNGGTTTPTNGGTTTPTNGGTTTPPNGGTTTPANGGTTTPTNGGTTTPTNGGTTTPTNGGTTTPTNGGTTTPASTQTTPSCKTDEKLENNVCVKVSQITTPTNTQTSPACGIGETLVDGICRTTRIQLCEEKNRGIDLFKQSRSQTCFNNVVIKNGNFYNENVISEKASVELSIQILPDISQMGMEADTLLFVFRYASNTEEWFVKDKQNWRAWSFKDWRGTSLELPSDSQRIKLGYNSNELTFDSFIPIFNGELKGFAGSYFFVYAGYRLMDGTVICNCQNPLVLHVVN